MQTAVTCLFADQARPVRAQASIFGYFSQMLDAQIRVAKSRGDYDDGIVRLKAESVELQGDPVLLHEEAGSGDTRGHLPHTACRALQWLRLRAES